MKQVIEEVLQAEEKAAAIGKEARAKASEIRQAAEKEAAEHISEAKGQVREIMQEIVEAGRTEGRRIRTERLAQADRDNEALLEGHAEAIKGLVEEICGVIMTTEREEA